MVIHKNCYGTILLVWLICLPLVFVILKYIPWAILAYPLAIIPMFFMGFVLFFFRVPQRERVGDDNIVTSVADGKVVVIEKVYEQEYIKGECLQVSVYMDFFNVHVNFWPVDGEVGMKTPFGYVFFKQIAGTFARRIVCHAKPGETVEKSDECGIIKFGSRIDMFLPLDADIKVKIGDYVKACESVIAELHK